MYVAFNPYVQPPMLCVSGNFGVFLLEMDKAAEKVVSQRKIAGLGEKYDLRARGVTVLPNGNFAVAANDYKFAKVIDPQIGSVVGYLYHGLQHFVYGACRIMNSRIVVFCDNTGNKLALCRSNAVLLSEAEAPAGKDEKED